jgi:hypothetical protein
LAALSFSISGDALAAERFAIPASARTLQVISVVATRTYRFGSTQ